MFDLDNIDAVETPENDLEEVLMLACLISRISLSIVRLSTKNPIRGWKS